MEAKSKANPLTRPSPTVQVSRHRRPSESVVHRRGSARYRDTLACPGPTAPGPGPGVPQQSSMMEPALPTTGRGESSSEHRSVGRLCIHVIRQLLDSSAIDLEPDLSSRRVSRSAFGSTRTTSIAPGRETKWAGLENACIGTNEDQHSRDSELSLLPQF